MRVCMRKRQTHTYSDNEMLVLIGVSLMDKLTSSLAEEQDLERNQ